MSRNIAISSYLAIAFKENEKFLRDKSYMEHSYERGLNTGLTEEEIEAL